jgi:uncharacterized protein
VPNHPPQPSAARNSKLRFSVLVGRFAICRLPADSKAPDWGLRGSFASMTRTEDELSIVCLLENVPPESRPELSWICMKLHGPFAFSETGILAAFISPLAAAEGGIFAISTYETDYVLVQQEFEAKAILVLRAAGHEMVVTP